MRFTALSRRAAALLILLSLAASPAFGFGGQGHRVIGALAEAQLSAAARSAVHELIGGQSLAEASTWADAMRETPDDPVFWGYDHAANWHFVNIPEGQDYARSRKHPAGDAFAALLAFSAVLEGGPLPRGAIGDAVRRYLDGASREQIEAFALRFLIHLVGDLHQPLHVGYEEDRGGNAIALRWFGRPTNLHRVWDSQLLAQAGRGDRAWLARLNALDLSLPEARRREIYAVERGTDLGQAYVDTWSPLLERQLLVAGLRLAALLERLFGQPATE